MMPLCRRTSKYIHENFPQLEHTSIYNMNLYIGRLLLLHHALIALAVRFFIWWSGAFHFYVRTIRLRKWFVRRVRDNSFSHFSFSSQQTQMKTMIEPKMNDGLVELELLEIMLENVHR